MIKNIRSILFIDFETRSEAKLLEVGAHRYLTDPSTEMLLVSYAFDNDEVKVCEEIPDNVFNAIEDDTVLKVAHNAEFDMGVCKYLLGSELNFESWFDTAYQAAYYGYPRSLHNLAAMLRTTQKLEQDGILLFSIPVRPSVHPDSTTLFCIPSPAVWNDKETNPEQWGDFRKYAAYDIIVMRECFNKMVMIPDIELFTMLVTFEMNFNGVPFDKKFASEILTRSKEYTEIASEEALRVYSIDNLRSTPQVLKALLREGVYLPSLNVKERGEVEHPILELRDQATGAAFSKIPTALARICFDDRLHGEFVGHGAHTGRWTSRGVQLQNLTRIYGEVSDDLSRVTDYSHLRQHMRLTVGNLKGFDFNCADLSQIEARIVAWLAECKWRMQAFANGEDIYSRSAEKMFGIPHVGKGDPERQDGKCSELGFGFGGGEKAILRINPKFYNSKGTQAVQKLVEAWRYANPEICQLWRTLEKAFRTAIQGGACKCTCGGANLYFKYDGRTASITLPSGRALYYRGAGLTQDERGTKIHYLDYSRGGDSPAVKCYTWGGAILENVAQAIARDVLVDIMQRMYMRHRDNMLVIGTVHDEIWYLSREGFKDKTDRKPLDILLGCMAEPIPWARGLITKGDGFTDKRYIK